MAYTTIPNGSDDPRWLLFKILTRLNQIVGIGTVSTNEAPVGVIDGSNRTFTISGAPINNSLMLFVNGVLQNPGAGNDYTISGNIITMLWNVPSGSVILATYQT